MIEITPLKSVGPFKFNSPIQPYPADMTPGEIEPPEPFDQLVCYHFMNDTVLVFVKGKNIDYVSVHGDCALEGVNIYKMNIAEFFKEFAIGKKDQEVQDTMWVSNTDQQNIYEIESLGLQLWVNGADEIVSVICDRE
jgi:hypothetical protein